MILEMKFSIVWMEDKVEEISQKVKAKIEKNKYIRRPR
jgi:hypothetical protein